MKKRSNSSIGLGPGAPSLILIFVILSMSVLGILALMKARNDLHLSQRSAEVAEDVYCLYEEAEETRGELENLAAACAAEVNLRDAESYEALTELIRARLPEGVSLEDGQICWEETGELRRLECALSLSLEDGAPRMQWTRHRLITELGEDTEDLWD